MVENRDQLIAFLKQDLTVCPDATQEIDLMLAKGDLVALHATYRGAQTGPTGPYPASGRSMELPFMAIFRLEGGTIEEMWVEWDNPSALTQLGHHPPAPPDDGGGADTWSPAPLTSRPGAPCPYHGAGSWLKIGATPAA